MKKSITLVSLNGCGNSGGVERVVYYLNDILSREYPVSIIKKHGRSHKIDKIAYPLFFSFILLFKKNTLVISNSWQSFLFPADFSIHHGTTSGYIRSSGISSKGSVLLSWMEKISAKCAKTVIAVSNNCGKELEEMYEIAPEKIIVLNNFVDERIFFPEPLAKGDIRKITILFSGRLEERKGLSKLVELAEFIEGLEKYQLSIASNSLDNAKLFENFKNTNIHLNIDITGMRCFYNSGDVLYFPTNYEGFSMATLEAMAAGVPVIGTEFAVPEELRQYDFAKIIDTSNPETVLAEVDSMAQKYKNKRIDLHNAIIKDFGYEQYKDKLLALIQGAMNG